MCGIAGYFRRDGAPASADVAGRMAAALAHRGPDGAGAWADGPVALGHVRLALRARSEAAAPSSSSQRAAPATITPNRKTPKVAASRNPVMPTAATA